MFEFLNVRKIYKRLKDTSPAPRKRRDTQKSDTLMGNDSTPFAEKLIADNRAKENPSVSTPALTPADVQALITPAKKQKIKKEKDLLQDALQDLENELKSLRVTRSQMERKVKSASLELGSTQRQELEMQNKINTLKRKENLLLKKSGSTKEKLEAVSKKIEKIKTIERQLKEM